MFNRSIPWPGTFVNASLIRLHWVLWGNELQGYFNASSFAISTATFSMILMGWGGATTLTSVV